MFHSLVHIFSALLIQNTDNIKCLKSLGKYKWIALKGICSGRSRKLTGWSHEHELSLQCWICDIKYAAVPLRVRKWESMSKYYEIRAIGSSKGAKFRSVDSIILVHSHQKQWWWGHVLYVLLYQWVYIYIYIVSNKIFAFNWIFDLILLYTYCTLVLLRKLWSSSNTWVLLRVGVAGICGHEQNYCGRGRPRKGCLRAWLKRCMAGAGRNPALACLQCPCMGFD